MIFSRPPALLKRSKSSSFGEIDNKCFEIVYSKLTNVVLEILLYWE